MSNVVRITSVEIINNRITVGYETKGEWSSLFNQDNFYCEYRTDITNVPKSIAIIPLMGTLLPLSWLFDGEIVVDELDKDYAECISHVKAGFSEMYPHMNFGGKVTAGKIVEHKNENNRSAMLFSGGLDAFHTLLSNIDKKPILVSIWGADITPDNEAGWSVVEKHIKETSEQFALEYEVIKCNFREINTLLLHSREELKKSGDGWWHGFHHGIGMLALVAPLAYVSGISVLYIASSFTAKDKNVTCSSDPKTDNFVRFCGCSVNHYGYESNRQEKTHNICEYARAHNQNIPVRVCWESKDGKNCCSCEKCYRTMLEFYAERENPQNYGFDFDKDKFSEIINNLKRVTIKKKYLIESQEALRKNYTYKEVIPELRWVYKKDFSKADTFYQHKKMKLSRRIYLKSPQFIKNIFSKIIKLKNKLKGSK